MKGFPAFDGFADEICGLLNHGQARKARCVDELVKIKISFGQEGVSRGDDLLNALIQLGFVDGWIDGRSAFVPLGIIGQRFAQRVHDADVIHDQAVAFAVCDAIGSCNRLHQGVRFQHLIQI